MRIPLQLDFNLFGRQVRTGQDAVLSQHALPAVLHLCRKHRTIGLARLLANVLFGCLLLSHATGVAVAAMCLCGKLWCHHAQSAHRQGCALSNDQS